MIELIFGVISSATFSLRMSSVRDQDDIVYPAAGISQPATASKNVKVMKITSKPLLCIQEMILL